jgi:hypothetical protein
MDAPEPIIGLVWKRRCVELKTRPTDKQNDQRDKYEFTIGWNYDVGEH